MLAALGVVTGQHAPHRGLEKLLRPRGRHLLPATSSHSFLEHGSANSSLAASSSASLVAAASRFRTRGSVAMTASQADTVAAIALGRRAGWRRHPRADIKKDTYSSSVDFAVTARLVTGDSEKMRESSAADRAPKLLRSLSCAPADTTA